MFDKIFYDFVFEVIFITKYWITTLFDSQQQKIDKNCQSIEIFIEINDFRKKIRLIKNYLVCKDSTKFKIISKNLMIIKIDINNWSEFLWINWWKTKSEWNSEK